MICPTCGRAQPCHVNCPGCVDVDDEREPVWDDGEEYEKDQLLGEE